MAKSKYLFLIFLLAWALPAAADDVATASAQPQGRHKTSAGGKNDAESKAKKAIIAKTDETDKILKDPLIPQEKKNQTIAANKREIEQTLAENPTSAVVHDAGAASAFKLGDFQTGLVRADKAIALAQNDPEPDAKLISAAMTTKAAGYAMMGDNRKAVSEALKALKVDQQNKEAFAVYQLSKGRPTGLKAPAIAEALAQQPPSKPQRAPPLPPAPQAAKLQTPIAPKAVITPLNPVQALIDDAKRKVQLKDFKSALDILNRAVRRDTDNIEARLERAKVSNLLKDYPGAVADAGKILSLEPQNVRALLERSLAQFQSGDIKEAVADAEAVLQIDPKNALAYFYRAQAEEKLGLLGKAKEDFQKAASLDPALIVPAASLADSPLPPKPEPPPTSPLRWMFRGSYVFAALALIYLGLRGAKTVTSRIVKRVATEPGIQAQSSATLPPGFVLGNNFKIIKELGRGGMGVVYAAEDRTLQRTVAIKQLYRNTHTFQEDLDQFLSEARTVAKLKHPNMVEIHSVVEHDDLYLVFDYIDGQSLEALLRARKAIPVEEAVKILRDIALAIDYAHSKKIFHRDLKPSNVMIAKDGKALVMDFGIAHQAKSGGKMTQTGIAGTPPYMAPEQATGSVCKESDIYSLAVMAYELLIGELPFPGPDFLSQKLRFSQALVSQKKAGLSAAWDVFFTKALQPDPLKRFHGGEEFVKAFEDAAKASTHA